ncbi:MAG: hypothetical protein U0360_02725 [Dehalococcoidia bacterium]
MTGDVVTCLSVIVTPGTAFATSLVVEYWVAPPFTLYEAFVPVAWVAPATCTAARKFPTVSDSAIEVAPVALLVKRIRSVYVSYVAVTPAVDWLIRERIEFSESTVES